MPFINVNKADFYYELEGQGAPLIFVSGYTCDHQVFKPVVEKLSSDYQVLVLDNRAVGQSRDVGAALTLD